MALEEVKVIDFQNVSKSFKVYKDKSRTLKEKALFHKRNQYTENKVLDNVSFTVSKGEALGLIGHNGCGKSTTLKLLNKILYPDSGEIVMKGKISSLIELGAGFHPDMSGRENVYINASIFGLKKEEIDERLDDIIRFSELEEFIDNPIRTYSSGMYMRLAFAIAINVDADILLIDEILAVGDAAFQKKCFNKLQEIKKNGATIVIVSHSMDQIKSICDRVLWLEEGRIREDGPADTVCNSYMVFMGDASSKREQKEMVEKGLSEYEDPNLYFPIKKVTSQFGTMSRRFGSMDVRFEKLHLENLDGKECEQYHYLDGLQLEYTIVKGKKSPENFHIVFNIVKTGGPMVSSFTSRVLHFDPGDDRISGFLRVSKTYLAKGDYHVDAFVFDEKGKMLDFLAWIMNFTVDTSEDLGTGVMALENEWV